MQSMVWWAGRDRERGKGGKRKEERRHMIFMIFK